MMPHILSYDGSRGKRIYGCTFSQKPQFGQWQEEITTAGQIYFEMPLITEKFYDAAYEFIRWLGTNHSATIIVNDYGMLLYCAELKNDGIVLTIVAGRLIGYQYGSIPWIHAIIQAEREPVRQSFLCSYFDSPDKIDVLREFGVSGIYCNYSEHDNPADSAVAKESLIRVQNSGFQIYLNITENVLAVNPLTSMQTNGFELSAGGASPQMISPINNICIADGLVTQKRNLRDADFADIWVI